MVRTVSSPDLTVTVTEEAPSAVPVMAMGMAVTVSWGTATVTTGPLTVLTARSSYWTVHFTSRTPVWPGTSGTS